MQGRGVGLVVIWLVECMPSFLIKMIHFHQNMDMVLKPHKYMHLNISLINTYEMLKQLISALSSVLSSTKNIFCSLTFLFDIVYSIIIFKLTLCSLNN